jgi:uncharacterized membrane protein
VDAAEAIALVGCCVSEPDMAVRASQERSHWLVQAEDAHKEILHHKSSPHDEMVDVFFDWAAKRMIPPIMRKEA